MDLEKLFIQELFKNREILDVLVKNNVNFIKHILVSYEPKLKAGLKMRLISKKDIIEQVNNITIDTIRKKVQVFYPELFKLISKAWLEQQIIKAKQLIPEMLKNFF